MKRDWNSCAMAHELFGVCISVGNYLYYTGKG